MNEFHDPELERLLGRASGAYPDANVAYEAVRGRVRQVKRRRAMVASTAACALLAGVVALGVRGGDDTRVRPADRGDTPELAVDSTTGQTEVSTPDTEMASDTTIAETTVATMMGGSGTGSGSPGGPGPSSGTGSRGTRSTTTTAPAVPVQPTTPTVAVTMYSSKGGSISVQIVDRKLVLVGTSPAAGFTAHVNEVSDDRIRVEFTNGTSSYEIQLELSNGMIKNTSQNKGP